MPLYYVDTSAVIKYYLPEAGSDWINALFSSESVTISHLAVAEFASVLARRTREGNLALQHRDNIFALFLEDTPRYAVLALTRRIVNEAAGLLLTGSSSVRLRALDAIHLATARWSFARARRRGIATGSFVTADRRLIEAAAWAGLPTMNPEDYS